MVELLVGVMSSPSPPLHPEPRWDTCQRLSREAKGQMDLQALDAPSPLHMVCADWSPELRQLQGRGCAAIANRGPQLNANEELQLNLLSGTFLCCWLRAQLLIPHAVGSSEVAFPSLAHVDPLFQCWGTSWQPKTDGAALRSACTSARGRQQAHALPSDNIGDGIST